MIYCIAAWKTKDKMFGVSSLSRAQRLALGMFILLLVDVIWVVSSELTQVSDQ